MAGFTGDDIPPTFQLPLFLFLLPLEREKQGEKNMAWCTGKTQRNRVEREVGVVIGMGNTCKSMADSCQCMTKTTTIL